MVTGNEKLYSYQHSRAEERERMRKSTIPSVNIDPVGIKVRGEGSGYASLRGRKWTCGRFLAVRKNLSVNF